MTQIRMLLGFVVTTLLCVQTCSATLVTFTFAGTVDNDPLGVFDSATFDGSYTFDSAIPQVLATPSSGGYASSGDVTMTVFFTGALDPTVSGPYVADSLNISINNDFPGPLDQYLVTGTSTTGALSIELTLSDNSGTTFSSTALTVPSLAQFTLARFALFAGTLDNPIEAEGGLESLQCTAGCAALGQVPEPDVRWLLAVSVLAAGVMTRRWSRR